MAEIYSLGPHDRMTPEECLSSSARDLTDLQEVIVIGIDADDQLVIRSSGMANKDALWLLLMGVDWARGV